MTRSLLLAVVLLALGSAPAAAVTTTVSFDGKSYAVRVTDETQLGGGQVARLGENNIDVTQDASGNLLVTDSGEGIDVVAGSGCFLQTADQVNCPPPGAGADIDITTGERQDGVDVQAPIAAKIYGGPGGDFLFGGPLADTIEGDGRRGDGSTPTAQQLNGPPDLVSSFLEASDMIVAGAGADTLRGQGFQDYLNGAPVQGTDTEATVADGGAGRDFFDAGRTLGPDQFTGGSGSDEPVSEGLLSTLLGGDDIGNGATAVIAGGDTVSYAARIFPQAGSAGVTADLDGTADDGATGEGDRIASDVESLVGSIRDDKLTGSAEANRLEGRAGVDQLIGASGPDRVRLKDGIQDRCFSLGTGDNVDADLADPTPSSCSPNFLSFATISSSSLTFVFNSQPVDETIPYVVIGNRLRRVRGGVLRAQVRCPRSAVRACTGTLAVGPAASERALARRRFRVPPGRTANLILRPRAAALERLEDAGRARLTAVSRGTSRTGPTTTFVIREI